MKALHNTVLEVAEGEPGRAALIVDGHAVSYRRLAGDAAAFAARLEAQRVSAGSRVILHLDDKRALLTAVIGSMAHGAIPVPFAGSLEQLAAVAADCDPAAIVSQAAGAGSTLRLLPYDPPSAGDADISRLARIPEPAQVAMLMYTSGTTSGRPRGVIQTHALLAQTAGYIAAVQGIDRPLQEVATAPIHHAFGLGRCRVVLGCGGTLVLRNGAFNVALTLIELSRPAVDALSGVSSVFVPLVGAEKQFRIAGGRLRWIEVGSLPLSRENAARLCALCPAARIVMNYGLTEAMRSTFFDLREAASRPGSVGRPAPGVEIRIVDESGEGLAPGEEGEIAVRGANLAAGYWGNDAEWARRTPGGWFRTGDHGRIDDDGYLFYIGRRDDMINVAGEKVSPEPIEAALRKLWPDRAFAVAGVPDPAGVRGHVPAVFVEGEAPANVAALQRELSGRLRSFEMPQMVVAVAALPRTRNGKVIRSALPVLAANRAGTA
jgi:long-chain acyl-CoA synthetase